MRKTVERVSPDLVQRISTDLLVVTVLALTVRCFSTVGNLFFLRFICPSLVTATKHNGEPLSKSILDSSPSSVVRQNLIHRTEK